MISTNLQHTLRDAMRLMRTGDLTAATQAIQRGLENPPPQDRQRAEPPIAPVPCLDGVCQVVVEPPDEAMVERTSPATESGDAQTSATGTFTCAEGTRDYLVYAPRERALRPAPLVLMLHGCTQTAADFARGTRMHLRAAAEGYVVVYPIQSANCNPNGCWNWFRTADQQRHGGEPAILAGLVAEMTRRFDCDVTRVYVAGLSAGGAMAITLGRTYPDVFRGVGAHSGLPHGCANDVPSALVAMRKGRKEASWTDSDEGRTALVPTIVFHGDRDHTVNVCNAQGVVDDAKGSRLQDGTTSDGNGWSDTATTGCVVGGYRFTTTCIRDGSGKLQVERWIIHGGGHAWFGGSPAGSYTDARGPDAAAEMLRFFASLN